MRHGFERFHNEQNEKRKMKNETTINAVKLAIAEPETWNMNLQTEDENK